MDDKKSGSQLVMQWRERFADLQNERLLDAGIDARVDHRTLEAQGIDREATVHLGPAANGYERRTNEASRLRLAFAAEAAERVKATGELEREMLRTESSIIELSTDLEAAKSERDRQQRIETRAPQEAAVSADRDNSLEALKKRGIQYKADRERIYPVKLQIQRFDRDIKSLDKDLSSKRISMKDDEKRYVEAKKERASLSGLGGIFKSEEKKRLDEQKKIFSRSYFANKAAAEEIEKKKVRIELVRDVLQKKYRTIYKAEIERIEQFEKNDKTRFDAMIAKKHPELVFSPHPKLTLKNNTRNNDKEHSR